MTRVISLELRGSGSYVVCCLLLKDFLHLFIFGCAGSSLLREGFLWVWRAGLLSVCGVQASHCGGFSGCGAQALGLSSCGSGGPAASWPVGIKPRSPALTGRLPTTGPPEKSLCGLLFPVRWGILLHPSALVGTQPRVRTRPHGGRVAGGPVTVLSGMVCDAGREASPAVTE